LRACRWITSRERRSSELAAGDSRLLYLAWLLAIQSDDADDEDTEPPVPTGLGELSAPLRAVADFLEIDKDLIAVAAQASPPLAEEQDDGLAEWIASVPTREKDGLLRRPRRGRRRPGAAAAPFPSYRPGG
jgi:hypothetical protein